MSTWAGCREVYRKFSVIILSALLLASAVIQRTGFKIAGYTLGDKPFQMIILTVVGCVPMNAVAYAYMVFKTGGVLPEYRTWRYFRDYWVIATLNIFNGIGIMWANPHVAGFEQALISCMAIPLTIILTVICFGTRYSPLAVTGVCCIIGGVLKVSLGGSSSRSDGATTNTSLLWSCMFIASQFPLSAASVYQESAFKKSLNMFHYVHYVTLFLLLDLVVCIPLDVSPMGDATSYSDFFDTFQEYGSCLIGLGGPACTDAGRAFLCYIFFMNLGTFIQALLVKAAGATWCMVVVSLGTPLGAIAFACPQIVGEQYVEALNPGVYLATALVTVGTIIYRVGSTGAAAEEECSSEGSDKPSQDDGSGYVRLEDSEEALGVPLKEISIQTDLVFGNDNLQAKELLELILKSDGYAAAPRPSMIASGVGLFSSEYTNARGNKLSLFEEKTYADVRARKPDEGSHGSGQRARSAETKRYRGRVSSR